MAYKNFEQLEVWQKGCRLSVAIYKSLSTCKNYVFKDQITRSSISIASNISEGAERSNTKEFILFLRYAKGSAGELRTQVYLAHQFGLISSEEKTLFLKEVKDISAMLTGLIKYLIKHLQKKTRP